MTPATTTDALDAHHDLTWLIGALARALHARRDMHSAILPALERVAGCDFNAPLADTAPRLAAACRRLPEAVVAALPVAEEVAQALAACIEHLDWRGDDAQWAAAEVLGPEGPVRCANGGIRLVIAAQDAVAPVADEQHLLFVLAGRAGYHDMHGALRQLDAGGVAVVGGHELRACSSAPLLAVLLKR